MYVWKIRYYSKVVITLCESDSVVIALLGNAISVRFSIVSIQETKIFILNKDKLFLNIAERERECVCRN